MTTAHRPTFDPARGKEALRGPAYHQRLAPAHTSLKFRQPGQGGAAGAKKRDLRAELLAAEAAHLAKRNGGALPATAEADDNSSAAAAATKRPLATLTSQEGGGKVENEEEDFEAKRRRVLEESRDMDADSEDDSDDKGNGNDNDDDDSDDDSDDDDAELQRELEKIRRERAEKREKEERERLAAEEAEREKDIALGNPLLNNSMVKQDFNMKRRWDDDVVFKNQARGTEDKGKQKEFINDLLRSDFHKRFMGKYVR